MSYDLDEYFAAQLGRRVSREEIAVAAGISIATYTRRKATRFTAGEVIDASRALGLSAAKVLLDLNYLTAAEILDAAGSNGQTIDGSTEVELAEALLRRLYENEGVNPAGPLDVEVLAAVTQEDYDLAAGFPGSDDDDENDIEAEFP